MARRARKAQQAFSKDSAVRIAGDDMVSALQNLVDGVQEQVVRSGAHAGAEVFYHAMRQRAPVETGTLRDSIYKWHDDKRSAPDRQIYVIGPNKKKAPHWHWVEYGNVHMAAQPYIRKAWLEAQGPAMDAMRMRMRERMSELLKGMKV